MADGDRMVPSEGNPLLDPTKKAGSGPAPVSFARDSAISRRLESSDWVRDQSGMLTHKSRIEDSVSAHALMNRFSGDKPTMSTDDILDKGDMDYLASLQYRQGNRTKGNRPPTPQKKRGSSQGDEQADDDKESSPIFVPQNQSAPRTQPNLGYMVNGGMPRTLREMMAMPLALTPMIGPQIRYCGPAQISPMNFNGAYMQSNEPETHTIAMGINREGKA